MVRSRPSVTGCHDDDLHTHRAGAILSIRLGVALQLRRRPVDGENPQDELKAHLMATSEEFRALAAQHAQYHKQLEELEAKPHLDRCRNRWKRFA